jgi:hypothetical protein
LSTLNVRDLQLRIVARGMGLGAAVGSVYGAGTWLAWAVYTRIVDGAGWGLTSAVALTPISAVVGAVIGWILGTAGAVALAVASGRRPLAPGRARGITGLASGGLPAIALAVVMLASPSRPAAWLFAVCAVGAMTGALTAPRLLASGGMPTGHTDL